MFIKLLVITFVNLAFLNLVAFPVQSRAQTQRKLTQPEAQKKVAAKSQNSESSENKNSPKKVMIVDFDARGIKQWWEGKWDIGSLFANSMVGPMSFTNSFEVVERERMKELFAEQGFSEDERFKPSSVTKVGRMLGADLILFGYLTDFSRKKKSIVLYTEVYAQIIFSARLVDVATGKVVNSADISYTSPKQKEGAIFTSSKEFNPNDPEFLQSMFGRAIVEASKLAVEKLSGEKSIDSTVVVNASSKNVKGNNLSNPAVNVPKPSAPATIADVTGNSVIITNGTNHGVSVGQTFAVVKVVKEVKKPNTNEIIFKKTEEIARIKITSVQAEASEGEIISGSPNAITVGAEVKKVN